MAVTDTTHFYFFIVLVCLSPKCSSFLPFSRHCFTFYISYLDIQHSTGENMNSGNHPRFLPLSGLLQSASNCWWFIEYALANVVAYLKMSFPYLSSWKTPIFPANPGSVKSSSIELSWKYSPNPSSNNHSPFYRFMFLLLILLWSHWLCYILLIYILVYPNQ